LLDDRLVHGAGGHVRLAGQGLVGEPFVVPEVEVGLGAVVQHEDLAVLERVHGAWVDVDVRVELLEGDVEAARLEEASEGGEGEALPEAGGDSTRDEHVCRSRTHYGSAW